MISITKVLLEAPIKHPIEIKASKKKYPPDNMVREQFWPKMHDHSFYKFRSGINIPTGH